MQFNLQLKNAKCENEVRSALSTEFTNAGVTIVGWDKPNRKFTLNVPSQAEEPLKSWAEDYNTCDQAGYNVVTLTPIATADHN